jgi:hypothetical protein
VTGAQMSEESFATGVVLLHPVGDKQLQAWTDRVTTARPSICTPGWRPKRCPPRIPKASFGSRRTFVSVALLTFVFMPLATRLFTRWLDPIDGVSERVSILGALVVIGVYAATLWLFASVQWLDFWKHG